MIESHEEDRVAPPQALAGALSLASLATSAEATRGELDEGEPDQYATCSRAMRRRARLRAALGGRCGSRAAADPCGPLDHRRARSRGDPARDQHGLQARALLPRRRRV